MADYAGPRAHHRAHKEEREARKHPREYATPEPLGDNAEVDARRTQIEGERAKVRITRESSLTRLSYGAQVRVPELAGTTGYAEPNYRPVGNEEETLPGATKPGEGIQGTKTQAGPAAGTEEAKALRMEPHLQFMAGPMLRYDTVDPQSGIWHGFAMIVTSDPGSVYLPAPTLTLRYASAPAQHQSLEQDFQQKASINGSSSSGGKQTVAGQQIYNYHALHGGNTFWRFKLEIALSAHEQPVHYAINGGAELQFWVPGRNQNLRWMGHSCNGFSAGVKTEDFNGPSPLWKDFLELHSQKPFHAVVGGGDQIYCDPISKEPELSEWITSRDEKWKASCPLTDAMAFALDRFLFNHYVTWFRNGDFARTIACVPMMNMLDDHDLIDGFGSYPDELMSSPVFSAIGARGYFWYLLFQNFIVDEVDGTSRQPDTHTYKSMIIGGDAAFIPTVSHSFLSWMGPQQSLLLLDCRAERRKYRICSEETYERCFARVKGLPSTTKHLTVLLGVPIAYPRMNFAEKALESSFNPLTLVAKSGLAFGGFVNKFDEEPELLDDLNDHWTATSHKKERNWLLEQFQALALNGHLRISILSGDVHAAGCGRLFSKKKVKPEQDPKYMLNIISSAIVNTPPPGAVINMVNRLAGKTHKTMHYCDTDEDMIDLWTEDTDGSKLKHQKILGRRNYVTAQIIEETGELEWDYRVEIKQGGGATKSYTVRAPRVEY